MKAQVLAQLCYDPATRTQYAIAKHLLADPSGVRQSAPVFRPSHSYPPSYDVDRENCLGHATDNRAGLIAGYFAGEYRDDGRGYSLGHKRTTDRVRLTEALLLDGFLAMTQPHRDASWPLDGWPVAAYLNPDEDIHYLRMDADGGWSEKQGVWDARKLTIRRPLDLMVCVNDDGDVYRLVGFFWAAPSRLRLRQPLPYLPGMTVPTARRVLRTSRV